MARLLVVELNDEGELDFNEASDVWSGWELIGVGQWIEQVGKDSLLSEEEAEDG